MYLLFFKSIDQGILIFCYKTKQELIQDLELEENQKLVFIDNPEAIENIRNWHNEVAVIKGDLIVPRPKKVVQSFEIKD